MTSGNDDPDAFNWRAGTQRKTLVMVTDTFRETFYSTDTEPSTATALSDADIEVHTINRPTHNSFYDDITSAANGQMHDIGNNVGSGVQSAFDDIAVPSPKNTASPRSPFSPVTEPVLRA